MEISRIKAADIPLEQLAGNKKISDPDKIAEVSRQFEAVLLRQILQATRKSSVTSTSSADASTSGIYDDMINNQLADCISRSGSLGLAKSLQGQLAHQVLPNADPRPPAATLLSAAPPKSVSENYANQRSAGVSPAGSGGVPPPILNSQTHSKLSATKP